MEEWDLRDLKDSVQQSTRMVMNMKEIGRTITCMVKANTPNKMDSNFRANLNMARKTATALYICNISINENL